MSTNPSVVDSTPTCSLVGVVVHDVPNSENEGSDQQRDSEQGEIDDESKSKSDVYIIDPITTLSSPESTTSTTKDIKDEEVCNGDDCTPYEKVQSLSQRELLAPTSSSCSSLDTYADVADDIDLGDLDDYLEDVQQATTSFRSVALQ